jgi:glycine oxidase
MTRTGKASDLVVVGGGAVGLAVALDAAGRGLGVTVFERSRPGREASWAAAGMLSPLGEAGQEGPFLEFGLTSLRMYPSWVRQLEEESGLDLEYRETGKLRVAFSEGELERLEARRRWADERGIAARWLDGDELRRVEPALAPGVRAGLLVHEDHQLENRRLGDALLAVAAGRGVEVRPGSAVKGVIADRHRARGVVLNDGTRVPAARVLLAAGAWSGALEGLPGRVPVRPVRGQILSLRPERPPSPHMLDSERVYLVPRQDGRLIVGATQEDVGFREGTTADGIRGLLEAAVELVPALGAAPLTELWSGLRPGTPDRNPIIGPDPDLEGLLIATGHFRNGILLAPATARLLGALVSGDEEPEIPAAFLPDRFRSARRGSFRTGAGDERL